MNYTPLHYQIALTLLSGIGPIRAKELLLSIDNVAFLFHGSPKELERSAGYNTSFFRKMNREEALRKADEVINYNKRNNINTLFYTDPDYPYRLKNCVDSPIILYTKGDIDLNHSKLVAIVGTRNATSYGKNLCVELITSLIDRNVSVVSGLAVGIDACAHRNCLENNLVTYGVLGHGFDRIYPAGHSALSEKIIKSGGLISEFIPGIPPNRENFPKRNRIVAGLCDATIVIESRTRGGSLITARLANDYNRDVFAYPGSVHRETSQGCNALIANQSAHLIQCPEDFLSLMNWENKTVSTNTQRKLFPALSEKQKEIVSCISKDQKIQLDVLSVKMKLPISKLNVELFNLEMEGVILSLPGKKYSLA